VTRWKPKTLSYAQSDEYPIAVAPNLYAHKTIAAQIVDAIKTSALRDKKEYVYSDLSYYLLPQIAPRMTGKSWTNYLSETFYKPLGATTLVYQAEKHFPMARIVPTEYDSLFRKTLIHGKVHDEGAALLDGISGHAGLFGNANDLAKLMQMYLQKGYYGGQQYLSEAVVKQWSSYPLSIEENARRGVGFDKVDRKNRVFRRRRQRACRVSGIRVLREPIHGLIRNMIWFMCFYRIGCIRHEIIVRSAMPIFARASMR